MSESCIKCSSFFFPGKTINGGMVKILFYPLGFIIFSFSLSLPFLTQYY